MAGIVALVDRVIDRQRNRDQQRVNLDYLLWMARSFADDSHCWGFVDKGEL